AILRDSVREAFDAKVIYFLFALSGLVILFAFSVSYKAEPGETGLEQIVKKFPGAQANFRQQTPPVTYTVEGFEQLNPEAPAWRVPLRAGRHGERPGGRGGQGQAQAGGEAAQPLPRRRAVHHPDDHAREGPDRGGPPRWPARQVPDGRGHPR